MELIYPAFDSMHRKKWCVIKKQENEESQNEMNHYRLRKGGEDGYIVLCMGGVLDH